MEINTLFYEGFEGEPRVNFYYEYKGHNKCFTIWIGYFTILLDNLFCNENIQDQILNDYSTLSGWYDGEASEIKELATEIDMFKSFKPENITHESKIQSPNIIPILSDLVYALLAFLEEANKENSTVYILYE